MRTKADQGHAQDAPLGSNEPTPIGLPRSARWALCCAALAAVGIVLPSVIAAEPLVRSALLAVTAGAVAAGAWIALVGEALAAGRATIRAALLWSALAAVATVGVAVADGLDAAMLAVAAGAALLVACFGLLLAWSYACTRDAATASAISITLAGLACAAPIWLGPIAESFAERTAVVNAIVAVSPLTYLAALADFDYLRATWFYEHSALGALRYEYPSVWLQSVLYALPLAAAATLELRANRSHPSSRSY
jgi:hypothetical protein